MKCLPDAAAAASCSRVSSVARSSRCIARSGGVPGTPHCAGMGGIDDISGWYVVILCLRLRFDEDLSQQHSVKKVRDRTPNRTCLVPEEIHVPKRSKSHSFAPTPGTYIQLCYSAAQALLRAQEFEGRPETALVAFEWHHSTQTTCNHPRPGPHTAHHTSKWFRSKQEDPQSIVKRMRTRDGMQT